MAASQVGQGVLAALVWLVVLGVLAALVWLVVLGGLVVLSGLGG